MADLHLCLSCPDKTMEDFGSRWENYIERIKKHWMEQVQDGDIVLVAGDISWALKISEVQKDLNWIDELPGEKIMIRGNHDYWWKSLKQIKSILPQSIQIIQNDALNFDGFSVGGSRLWDTSEFSNIDIIEYKENPKANPDAPVLTAEENEKIYLKELNRLELSLSKINPAAPLKIAMVHYPPLRYDLSPSKVHNLLLKYNIQICVFGHIHNLKNDLPPLFGTKDGIQYLFTAADYLKFKPLKVAEV